MGSYLVYMVTHSAVSHKGALTLHLGPLCLMSSAVEPDAVIACHKTCISVATYSHHTHMYSMSRDAEEHSEAQHMHDQGHLPIQG